MKPKVIVIVGPTASGKTSLSIKLAQHFNGEVISADSRQVYRGLNLGTGKVTSEEMQDVPHHMLDVADPTTVYTASDYVESAREAVSHILERNRLPIIAGGSFFYVDALLGRVTLPEVPPNSKLRTELDAMSTEALFALLQERDERRAQMVDPHNRPRLMRALEINAELGAVPLPRTETLYEALILGIDIDRETLFANIHTRIMTRLEAGMIDEVKQLNEGGLSYDRMDSLGLEYRYISQYLQETLSYEDMITTLDTKTRQFAKRQMTWLKRNKEITWVKSEEVEKIENLVKEFLKK